MINPVSHQFLLDFYSDVNHPEQKIKYQKSIGNLLPIQKGWYLFKDKPYSNFYIANLLYGPSYVTGLSVLSYYGFIADKAVTVHSSVFKRGKKLDTKVGLFLYSSMPRDVFHIGITSFSIDDLTSFIIASPTKALYDHIIYTPNLYFTGKDNLEDYLENDLRFDMDRLHEIDQNILAQLIDIGEKQRQISILSNLVKDYSNDRAMA